MPNHVKNILKFEGTVEKISKLIEKYKTVIPAQLSYTYDEAKIICENDEGDFGWYNPSTGEFEFSNNETVKGLPDGYKFKIKETFFHFPDFEKIIAPPANIFRGNLGEKERKECEEKGIPNWYDWNYENWGTKWNSYSCERISLDTYSFETAWSGVPKLIKRISLQFPDVKIIYKYADEDFSYNTGEYHFLNGEQIYSYHPEGGSNEAFALALEIRPEYQDDIEFVDGKYQWKN